MKDKALLACRKVLDKFTKEELSKFHWEQKVIMEDLLRNLITDVFMFIDLKTKHLKNFSDEQIKKMEEKLRNIIKIYMRMKKNPQMMRELLKQSREKPGWLKYQEIMEIYKKFYN